MTLDELETQLLIAQNAVEACMSAFRDDPVTGISGKPRRETYAWAREAERSVEYALDEVRAVNRAARAA